MAYDVTTGISNAISGSQYGPVGAVLGGLSGFLGGGGMSARKSAALQYEYARNWAREELPLRVEGAKAAGLHPLAVLGGGSTFSPAIAVGGDNVSPLRGLGQDISRAANAYSSKSERANSDVMAALSLERAKLENDLLRSQITAINRPTTPPFPSGSISGDVQFNPDEVTSTTGKGAFTAGSNVAKPAVTVIRNRDGSTSTIPSQDAKQGIEDSLIYETDHFFRNRINPYILDTANSIRRAWDRAWWNPNSTRKMYRR